jgi:phage/plasmid-like protein (TIGR03299 family)
MTAQINVENGIASAMFADVKAWHNLGQIVEGTQTWQETIKQANLDWKVEKHQLMTPWATKIDAWGMFRADNAVFLGAVGAQYEPIQNEYAFSFVDSLLEAADGAHYDSAGALGKGERIFVSAKIPFEFRIDGTDDKHLTYLLFVTSHDGSLSAQCKLTDVRVVCNNTLQQALNMGGAVTRIKHTKTAEERLERAKKMMAGANSGVMSLKSKLDALSKRVLDKDTYVNCLDRIFPKDAKDQSSPRRDNILKEITELFASNDDNAIPEVGGTAYNLLNGITEYTDHYRPTRITAGRQEYTIEQSRSEAALFGSGAQLKSKALDEIIKATEHCEIRQPQIYSIPGGKPSDVASKGGLLAEIIDATNIN